MTQPSPVGWGLSLRVALLAFLAFLLLLQPQPHGDGISYIWYLQEGNLLGHHLLYLPVMKGFCTLAEFFGISTRSAAFLFSALCGGAAVLLMHRLLASSRALCPGARHPWLWTLIFAACPAVLFYSTTVENHAHHLFWCCAFLLCLDRVLASEAEHGRRLWLWPSATILLLAVYTSHSSSLLLWPGLLLCLHLRQGRLLRLPQWSEISRYLLLFGPVLLFKLAEPLLKARVFGGGEEQLSDAHTLFALDLLGWRDLSTWLEYLGHEVLLPIGAALVAGGFALRGRWLGMAVSILLPYLLFFGHWNIYEYGAYYLAPLPLLLLLSAASSRPQGLGAKSRAVVLVVTLGLMGYGLGNTLSYTSRHPEAVWNWAKDLRQLADSESTVIVYYGVRGITLLADTDIHDVQMLESWWMLMAPAVAAKGPDVFKSHIYRIMPELFASWTAKGKGPLIVSKEARAAMQRDWPPLLAWLEQHASWEPISKGIFSGFVLKAR